jgi:hypothetical protein
LPLPAEEVPVFTPAVAPRSPATVLFVPGTTALPVAPGTCGLRSVVLGIFGVALLSAGAICDPVVPDGGAVTDLLLPILAVGALLWANPVSGMAKIAATNIELRSVEVISSSL